MSLAFRGIDEKLLDVIAAEHGRSTEDVYLEWMSRTNQYQTDQPSVAGEQGGLGLYDPDEDPLADLLGAFRSGIPDLGRRHDKYLGQDYLVVHPASLAQFVGRLRMPVVSTLPAE